MKKFVFLVIAAVSIAALFLSCQKTSEAGSDEKACEEARKENTRAAWERYLREFPAGKCVEDGKAVRNKFKKIDGLEWSDISVEPMSISDIGGYESDEENKDSYCDNLAEDGHSDWRLPTIDELRVLIQNHPGTVVGGKCKTSASYLPSCRGIEGNNFSKLGDNVELWSSSSYSTPRATYNKSIDFSNGSFSSGDDYHDSFYVRCVRQDDNDACEAARKAETDEAWEHYLSYFPKGKCAKEAKAGAKEDAVCERAKKANTRAAWEKYLKKFPKGKCAEEGNAVRNKYKKIGNLEWSDVIENEKRYDDESDYGVYCEALVEDGHTDWRVPNIDELRTLLQNHPGTVTGGKCRISEHKNLLDYDALDDNCAGIEGDNFSKLGDEGYLDSISSHSSRMGYNGNVLVYSVYFDDGGINSLDGGGLSRQRCVRQEDKDACETARKYNKLYYWKHYLENFPKGKCVKEAKAFRDKEDQKACAEARAGNESWYWEEYLKKFPKGKCTKEAKKIEAKNIADKKEVKQSETNQTDKKAVPEKIWSSKSSAAMPWKQAVKYCENLKERGSSEWRLPTISELRTLITECKRTETEGACKVTNNCLSVDQCKNKACRGCGKKVGHNKFGDKGFFWSSSISSENKNAWYIDFTYASIHSHSNGEKFVRCVGTENTSDNHEKCPQGNCTGKTENVADKKEVKQTAADQQDKKALPERSWSSKSSAAMPWKQAVKYCENLKEGEFSDWRLPTISELRSLITKCESTEASGICGVSDNCLSMDSCKNNACKGCGNKVGHNKFGDKGFFWSSSINSENKNAWYIDFTYASIHSHSDSDKFVRCVRSEITRDDDGVLQTMEDDSCASPAKTFPCKDYETGYIWSDMSEKVMNWEGAKEYCVKLKEGTGNNWRLPNIDELRSIFKGENIATGGVCRVSEKNKCLDSNCWSTETCFEACESKIEDECVYKDGRFSKLGDGRSAKANIMLWSSSPKPLLPEEKDNKNKKNKSEAWYIDANKGYVHSYRQDSKFYVRCVR